jgi:hypothetical protein
MVTVPGSMPIVLIRELGEWGERAGSREQEAESRKQKAVNGS